MIFDVVASSISGCGVCTACLVVCDLAQSHTTRHAVWNFDVIKTHGTTIKIKN
jgi:hypothetical protein